MKTKWLILPMFLVSMTAFCDSNPFAAGAARVLSNPAVQSFAEQAAQKYNGQVIKISIDNGVDQMILGGTTYNIEIDISVGQTIKKCSLFITDPNQPTATSAPSTPIQWDVDAFCAEPTIPPPPAPPSNG